jgi:hypothetical protein
LIDQYLDKLFEGFVSGDGVDVCDVWGVARELLKVNYDLTDDEIIDLLEVAPGPESQRLLSEVLNVSGGGAARPRTYTAWVRASLLANGLADEPIPAVDLANVMTILIATNRTIPLTQFADACRLREVQTRLEALV